MLHPTANKHLAVYFRGSQKQDDDVLDHTSICRRMLKHFRHLAPLTKLPGAVAAAPAAHRFHEVAGQQSPVVCECSFSPLVSCVALQGTQRGGLSRQGRTNERTNEGQSCLDETNFWEILLRFAQLLACFCPESAREINGFPVFSNASPRLSC